MARRTKAKLETWLNQIGEMWISTQHPFEVRSSHPNLHIGSVWLLVRDVWARF
jgi:hypothetical protein